jgi:hypothetical protein
MHILNIKKIHAFTKYHKLINYQVFHDFVWPCHKKHKPLHNFSTFHLYLIPWLFNIVLSITINILKLLLCPHVNIHNCNHGFKTSTFKWHERLSFVCYRIANHISMFIKPWLVQKFNNMHFNESSWCYRYASEEPILQHYGPF